MAHVIEQFSNGEKDPPGILYRPARNYIRKSLVAFSAGLLMAALGAVIINDYAFGWATTCNGTPMPFWPSYIGGVIGIAGGWLIVTRGYAIMTILDPFAEKFRLDAREAPKKVTDSDMEQAEKEFDARTERKRSEPQDPNVIEGDWIPGDTMPA